LVGKLAAVTTENDWQAGARPLQGLSARHDRGCMVTDGIVRRSASIR
jgi:hypothetical protein